MAPLVGFEVLAAVVMNVAICWDIAPCSQYVNRRFGETFFFIRTTRRYIPEDGNIPMPPRLFIFFARL
jgi:hypothetical protein